MASSLPTPSFDKYLTLLAKRENSLLIKPKPEPAYMRKHSTPNDSYLNQIHPQSSHMAKKRAFYISSATEEK
jgi:hypothetical protein